MPQVDQDLTIYQNADETITIAIKDENDDPMDLKTFDDLCWILTKAGREVVRYDINDSELIIANADDTDDGLRVMLYAPVTSTLRLGRLYTHQAWGTFGGASRPLAVGYVTVKRGDGC